MNNKYKFNNTMRVLSQPSPIFKQPARSRRRGVRGGLVARRAEGGLGRQGRASSDVAEMNRWISSLWSYYSPRLPDGKIVSLPFLGSKEKKGYNFAIWQPCPSLPCMSLPPRRRLFVLTLSICTRIHTRSGFHVGLGRGCVAFTFDIPPVMYASLLQKQ